jgi:hypothetical protein
MKRVSHINKGIFTSNIPKLDMTNEERLEHIAKQIAEARDNIPILEDRLAGIRELKQANNQFWGDALDMFWQQLAMGRVMKRGESLEGYKQRTGKS